MGLAELLCTAVIAVGMPRTEYACKHMDTVVKEAEKNNVSPVTLVALIHEESRWKPWVVSKAGACGLTQVMPKYTKGKWTCNSLKNPTNSIRAGASALAFWVYKYGKGDYRIGLCGYNGGYRCRGEKRNRRSLAYAKRVIKMTKKLEESIEQQREFQRSLRGW